MMRETLTQAQAEAWVYRWRRLAVLERRAFVRWLHQVKPGHDRLAALRALASIESEA